MLSLAGMSTLESVAAKHETKQVSIVAPIEAGILDLRSRFKSKEETNKKFLAFLVDFIQSYRVFFIILIASISFIYFIAQFVQSAATPTREFEITASDGSAGIYETPVVEETSVE